MSSPARAGEDEQDGCLFRIFGCTRIVNGVAVLIEEVVARPVAAVAIFIAGITQRFQSRRIARGVVISAALVEVGRAIAAPSS